MPGKHGYGKGSMKKPMKGGKSMKGMSKKKTNKRRSK